MAKTRTSELDFVTSLVEKLESGLQTAGIQADVQTEHISGTKLHRVTVLAKKFDKLRPSERQDLVWRIVSQSFTPKQQLQISMVITLTPAELNW